MAVEIAQSHAARQDLKEIWLYTADAASPERADRVLDALYDTYETLAEYPQIGRDRSADLRPGLRSYVSGPFVVFYEPRPASVEIVRVLRAERDADTLLGS